MLLFCQLSVVACADCASLLRLTASLAADLDKGDFDGDTLEGITYSRTRRRCPQCFTAKRPPTPRDAVGDVMRRPRPKAKAPQTAPTRFTHRPLILLAYHPFRWTRLRHSSQHRQLVRDTGRRARCILYGLIIQVRMLCVGGRKRRTAYTRHAMVARHEPVGCGAVRWCCAAAPEALYAAAAPASPSASASSSARCLRPMTPSTMCSASAYTAAVTILTRWCVRKLDGWKRE